MFKKLIEKFNTIDSFVELEIKYKKFNGEEYYYIEIYFESDKYTGGRAGEIFDTIEGLEKYIDDYILDYNL